MIGIFLVVLALTANCDVRVQGTVGLRSLDAGSTFHVSKSYTHSLQGVPTPVVYYNFDSSSGTSVSPQIGSVTATLVHGAAIVANGIQGNAVSVSRSANSWVDFGPSLYIPTGTFPNILFSLQVWVKTTDTSGALATFLSHTYTSGQHSFHGVGWRIVMGDPYAPVDRALFGVTLSDPCSTTANGEAEYYYGVGCVNSAPTVINDGNWHQVVITYSTAGNTQGVQAGYPQVYIDGVLAATAGSSSTPPSPASGTDFLVGGVTVNGAAYNSYTGEVDELKIWNQALTAAQVMALYQATLPSPSGSETPSTSAAPSPTDTPTGSSSSAASASSSFTSAASGSTTSTPTTTPTPSPATLTFTQGPQQVTAGQSTSLTATIDRPLSVDVVVSLNLAGAAKKNIDYTSGNSITIPAGQLSASLTIDCITTQPTVHLTIYIAAATVPLAPGVQDSYGYFLYGLGPSSTPSGTSVRSLSSTETRTPSTSPTETQSPSFTNSASGSKTFTASRTASKTRTSRA